MVENISAKDGIDRTLQQNFWMTLGPRQWINPSRVRQVFVECSVVGEYVVEYKIGHGLIEDGFDSEGCVAIFSRNCFGWKPGVSNMEYLARGMMLGQDYGDTLCKRYAAFSRVNPYLKWCRGRIGTI